MVRDSNLVTEKSLGTDPITPHSSEAEMPLQEILCPDGGIKAWMSVLGGFLASLISVGYVSAFAVFQTYYSTNNLADHTQDQISWIGSIQVWGCFSFGIVSGWLSDTFGPKVPVGIGGVILVFGTMMSSISTEYYQILLSQGICSALGLGLIFTPCLSIQSQWFSRKRGLAVGLVMSGQNVGGVIWPIIGDSLLNELSISLAWMQRIFGFIQLALLLVAVILIQRRFDGGVEPQKFDVKEYFTNGKMVLFTAANFFFFFALYVPYFYISLYGIQYGSSYRMAFYLPAILNAAACLGCYALGSLADRVTGLFNTITVVASLCSITAFAWIAADDTTSVIVWVMAFGFLTGGIQALFSPCIAILAPKPEVIGTWNGISMFVLSFPVLTNGLVGGKLLEYTGGTGYVPMQVFTGASLLTAAMLYLLTRIWVSRGLRI